jgi:HEAT repeat protein
MSTDLWMIVAGVAVVLLLVDLVVSAAFFGRRFLTLQVRRKSTARLEEARGKAAAAVREDARPLVEAFLAEQHWANLRDLADQLMALDDPSVVAPLAEVLLASHGTFGRNHVGHPTPLQFFLVRILARCGKGRVDLQQLAQGLRSPDPVTRDLVAELLGELGDESVAGPLVEALFDAGTTPETARAVGVTLGRIGGPRALDALLRYATTGRWAVCAVKGLGAFAKGHALAESRAQAVAGAVVASLQRQGGVRERQCAADALGSLGEPVLSLLVEAVRREADPHGPVVEACVTALGMVGGPKATEALRAIADDEAQPHRFWATRALAAMGTDEARRVLRDRRGRERDTAVSLVISDALKQPGLPSAG